MPHSLIKTLAAGAIAAAAAMPAAALDVINLSGVGGTGVSYTGLITYDPLAATELSIELTNTTSAGVGGFLTAFGFDFGGTVTNVSNPISDMSFASNVNVAPFGTRQWAMGTGGQFEGGGSPNGSLGVGSTATWTFDVAGGPGSVSLDDLQFVARFRGLSGGGSDKVPAIPEPETYALMLAGLGLVTVMARRRRSE